MARLAPPARVWPRPINTASFTLRRSFVLLRDANAMRPCSLTTRRACASFILAYAMHFESTFDEPSTVRNQTYVCVFVSRMNSRPRLPPWVAVAFICCTARAPR